MDRTSIDLGSSTRDDLREYKEEHGHKNYDVAVQSLLGEQEGSA